MYLHEAILKSVQEKNDINQTFCKFVTDTRKRECSMLQKITSLQNKVTKLEGGGTCFGQIRY